MPVNARQPRSAPRLPENPVPIIATLVIAGPIVRKGFRPKRSDATASGRLLRSLVAPTADPTSPNSVTERPSSAAKTGMTGKATPRVLKLSGSVREGGKNRKKKVGFPNSTTAHTSNKPYR